jgi:diguanylate cyclase (GGDEF)-like protein
MLRWRLALALLVGGALAGWIKALLTLPLGGSVGGPILAGSVSAVVGLLVLRAGPQLGDRWYLLSGHAGVVVLTSATYAEGLDGTVAADNVLFYVWPVLFFAAFLPRRWMWTLVATSSIAYCTLLGLVLPSPLAIGRACTMIGTLAGSGWLVAELRDHADAALRTVHEQSVTDPLTGLLNRRGLSEGVSRLGSASAAPISLLLCDLDHFKRVNDLHGHDAGDLALRRVADVLRQVAGDEALVARQGGEEFVVAVTGPPERAGALAETVRHAVRDASRIAGEPLTISIGLASSPPHDRGLAPLLRAADAALYLAKTRGRDRVVSADGLTAMDVVA